MFKRLCKTVYKFAFASLLALSLVNFGAQLDQKVVERRLAKAEVLIELPDGTCSGTFVGSHTILTAEHCITGDINIHEPKSFDFILDLGINGHVMTAQHFELDGCDHMLITVEQKSNSYLTIDASNKHVREQVTSFGHPGGRERAQLQTMTIDGFIEGTTPDVPIGTQWDASSLPGVSGEALVDWRGRVVAMMSLASDNGESLSIPFRFSAAQLRSIK